MLAGADRSRSSGTTGDARVRHRGHAGTLHADAELTQPAARRRCLFVDGQERRATSEVGQSIGAREVAPRLRLTALLVAPREGSEKQAERHGHDANLDDPLDVLSEEPWLDHDDRG